MRPSSSVLLAMAATLAASPVLADCPQHTVSTPLQLAEASTSGPIARTGEGVVEGAGAVGGGVVHGAGEVGGGVVKGGGEVVEGVKEGPVGAGKGVVKGTAEVGKGVGKGAIEVGKGVGKGVGCVVTLGKSC